MSARARRIWSALAVAVLLGAGLAWFVRKRVSELPVYTTAGARIAAGAEIYDRGDPKPFTYPPFFALPFVPLAALPETSHRPIWYLVNVLALCWIVRRVRGTLRPLLAPPRARRGPREAVFWLCVALLAGRHVTAVFENQSHDLLVLLLVVLGVTARAREGARAGAWLGAGAACKATPLLFLAALLAQRRWRAAAGLAAAAAACTLLPDLLFPRADGLWVAAWAETFLTGLQPGRPAEAEGAWLAWNLLNQNLAGTLHRLGTPVAPSRHTFDVSLWSPPPTTLQAVTIAAQLAVLGLLLAATRPGLARGEREPELALRRLGEGGAVACGMVLLSPMSSKSHFCVLLIAVSFCVAELLYRRRSLGVALLLGFVFVSGTLTARELVGRELGRELLARGSVTWSTLAVLAATCVLLMRRCEARL